MANRFLNNIRINDEYTLPENDGSAGQAIVTDGSGNLSFGSAVASSADSTESIHITVKNTSGATITKGTPVYITGETGNSGKIEVAPADASDSAKMPAVGILESTLNNNVEGFCVQGGLLEGLSTATIDGTTTTANDTVYIKAGGGLTMTKPTGTNFIQNIAKVARVHASNGSLVVSSILRTNDVPTPLYIDHANQRLGIGEPSPSSDLHINNDFTSPVLRLSYEPVGGYGGGGSIRFQGGASDYVYGNIAWYNGANKDADIAYSAASRAMNFKVNERNVSTNGYFRFYNHLNEVAEINASGIYGNVFYDQGNTSYYVNPASTSTSINTAGAAFVKDLFIAYSGSASESNRAWFNNGGVYQPGLYFDGSQPKFIVNSLSQSIFHDGYHPNADTWTTARTITIGSTGKSVNGSANVSWSLSEIGATSLDHIRSLGTQAFTNGSNPDITTSQVISEIESDGGFDSYTSVFKTSWSYAGNYNLTDAGRFTETAGSSWITWTDNSSDSTRGYITALAIAPNTGDSAGKVFIYNDQGSGYSPGWREVWTSTSDGSGSGLDADLLDGQHASAFQPAGTYNTIIGTDSDINTSGSTIIDNIYVTDGVITSMGTRTLTASDLGIASTELVKNYQNVNYVASDPTSSGSRANYGLGVTVYEGFSSGSNRPHTYDATVQFMPTGSQGFELSANWIGTTSTPLKIRSLRDTAQGWSPWVDVAVSGTTSSGTFSTSGDYRAPIFYDSNNTSYYVNPASDSILQGLLVSGGEFNVEGGDGYRIEGKPWAYWASDVLTLGDWDGEGYATRIMGSDSSEVMRVTGANVGINTINPNQKLTIRGNDNYVATEHTSYAWGGTNTIGVRMGTDSTAGRLDFRRWNGSVTHGTAVITQVNSDGGYGLDFRVDNKSTNTHATTSRMFLSTSGEVGIGTTSPGQKLHVIGNVAADVYYYRLNTAYFFNGGAGKDNVDLTSSANYALHALGTISGGHRKHGNLETPEMQWSVGGGTDLNWKKLCDFVINDASYSGWGAEIEITNFSGNYGSATYSGGELYKGALSIYHAGGTGTNPEIAYANIPYDMRSHVRWYKIQESGKNRYQLQVKSPGNYQQLYVKVKPGIGNQIADIISYSNDTNGATSGGTAYTSIQSANFNHEFAGGIWTNDSRSIGWKNAYGSPYLSSYYGSITTSAALYVGGPFSTSTSLYAGNTYGSIFYNRQNSAYYMDGDNTGDSIRVAGDVVAYYSSDKRLKDNIEPIYNALDKVKAISGVTFEWNEKSHKTTGKKDVGVVAQEIEAVLPELVETRTNGYKAVDYQKLTAVLIESVKELTAKVEALESKQCNCK